MGQNFEEKSWLLTAARKQLKTTLFWTVSRFSKCDGCLSLGNFVVNFEWIRKFQSFSSVKTSKSRQVMWFKAIASKFRKPNEKVQCFSQVMGWTLRTSWLLIKNVSNNSKWSYTPECKLIDWKAINLHNENIQPGQVIAFTIITCRRACMACYAVCRTTRISISRVAELALTVGIHTQFQMCQVHVNVCGRWKSMDIRNFSV